MQVEKSVKNRYDARCRICGGLVEAGTGLAELDGNTGKWRTRHEDGNCIAATNPANTKPMTTIKPEDEAVDKVVSLMAGKLASELVPQLVAENMAELSRTVEITVPKMPKVKVSTAHKMLPTVLQAIVAGASPFLVGPAGSGKTTLGEQIAKALGRKFYMAARVTSEYKLTGFIDANGKLVRTAFREWYEHGGVFLFDEVDSSDADALTAFNAALSNGYAEFPDGLVQRHKDAVALAAGNTFGRGADRQYVGRQQLDAATLDRFVILEVDYDDQLELEIAGDAEWVRRVQKVRRAVEAEKVRHIVSPRASIMGARMLAAGMDSALVEEACIWKGMDTSNRTRVEARLGGM
jgi:cytidylate kinase